ncbi:hypothetical protein PO124_10550 [Bacillus licheniformis]|nr:hypothetical protein [Bacillus licheniformis]
MFEVEQALKHLPPLRSFKERNSANLPCGRTTALVNRRSSSPAALRFSVYFIRFIGQDDLFLFHFNEAADRCLTLTASVRLKTRSTL